MYNMEKVFSLPVPDAMIDPLDAPIRENQVRLAWAAVAGGVIWWAIIEMTALSVTTGLQFGAVATTVLAVVAALLALTFIVEYATTRYVSATRRVAQRVMATAIYLRAAARRIGCVFSVAENEIGVEAANGAQERGGTGPAPPSGERDPHPQHANLIRCAGRRSKEAGHRVAGLHMLMPV